MPYVKGKKFAYTDAGKKKAYEYAKKVKRPIRDVNKFGSKSKSMSLDRNRFGRRDQYKNKKKK